MPDRRRANHRLDDHRDHQLDDHAVGRAPSLFDADEVMENADEWWKDCAGRALTYWAQAGVDFTAADVIALGIPEPDSNGRMGALFRAACARGEIEPVGYQPSTQPSRHGSVVRVWRGRRAA